MDLRRFAIGGYRHTGADIHAQFGLLVHYTTRDVARLIVASGMIGAPGRGLWLSPSPYAACVAPYNLGVDTPRDLVLLVDVSGVAEVWGPGSAAISRAFPDIWRGGAVEFYVPHPIPLAAIRSTVRLDPCGDTH
jgi:hypothetical protein